MNIEDRVDRIEKILGISDNKIERDEDWGRVIQVVSNAYGLTKEDVLSEQRHGLIPTSRQVIWYILNRKMGWSVVRIANKFQFNHTTVIYGIQKVEDKESLKKRADIISESLGR